MLEAYLYILLKFNAKLTINYLELPVGANIRVRLAAQTLSRRTAVAIRCYYRLNMMDEAALDTADFILEIVFLHMMKKGSLQ